MACSRRRVGTEARKRKGSSARGGVMQPRRWTLRRLQRSPSRRPWRTQRCCASGGVRCGTMRTGTVLAAFVLLVLTAPAMAQAPDERAAAQALADAVIRLEAADRAVEEDHDPDDGLDAPRCRHELFRIPPRRQGNLRPFALRDEIRKG